MRWLAFPILWLLKSLSLIADVLLAIMMAVGLSLDHMVDLWETRHFPKKEDPRKDLW